MKHRAQRKRSRRKPTHNVYTYVLGAIGLAFLLFVGAMGDSTQTVAQESNPVDRCVGEPKILPPHDNAPEPEVRVVTDTVSVKDFGAVGDGVTDDSFAFRSAQASISIRGGGTIIVPHSQAGYVIGDGETWGTAIVPTQGTTWRGETGARLIHRAKESREGRNYLFHIKDVENVRIIGIEIDGNSAPGVGIALESYVKDIILYRLHLHDILGYAIKYATGDNDLDTSRYVNVQVRYVKVDGKTGSLGDGAGINFYSATQSGQDPRSRRLRIEDTAIDVSQGTPDVQDDGPQGIKLSNADGVNIQNVQVLGGRVSGIDLVNGIRNVEINNVETLRGKKGVVITTNNDVASTVTQNIHLTNYTHVAEKLSDARSIAIDIWGSPRNVVVENSTIQGSIALKASDEMQLALSSIAGEICKTDEMAGSPSNAKGISQGMRNGMGAVRLLSGVFALNDTVTTPRGSGVVTRVTDMNELKGVILRNLDIQRGDIYVVAPASPVTNIEQMTITDIRFKDSLDKFGRILLSTPNRKVNNSTIDRIQSDRSGTIVNTKDTTGNRVGSVSRVP